MIDEIWHWVRENSDGIEAVSLVAAAIAGFIVIRYHAIISRREATIRMVDFQLEEGREGYQEFKDLMKTAEEAGPEITEYAIETSDTKAGRDIILAQLNRYELISLGIKQKVFSERFYKRWFYSQFTRDFAKLTPFIETTRTHYNNMAYYCEFESLAHRWERKRHPVKHPPRWKVIWWLIINQPVRAKQALESEHGCP